MIDKVKFELELPDGEETKTVKSTDLTDEQYALATQMQAIQSQVQNLAASVTEYGLKKDHFRLKQKELLELLEYNGSPSKHRQTADST